MKFTKFDTLYVILLLLALAGVTFVNWIAFSLFTVILAAILFSHVFERLYPKAKPDPTGAELLAELDKHKAEIRELVAGLKSKMPMPSQIGRRE